MDSSRRYTCATFIGGMLIPLLMASLPAFCADRGQSQIAREPGASGQPVQRLLPLRHAANARDLGGYANAEGRTVKWGMLYRSDSIANLDARDLGVLHELQLSVVTDFRSVQEREGARDRLPQQDPAIVYRTVAVNNPGLDVAELGRRVYAGDITNDELLALLDRRAYVTDPALRAAWGNWLRSLGEPGALPQLFHCTAGKDRTGFAAAIVLLALGVPRESVMDDFLLSNHFLSARIEEGVARIQANTNGGLDPDVLAQVIGVSASSLEDALTEMALRYGSVDGYIRDGLGIDEATRVRLQQVLLE
ncbi:tyrosine-protein phosphatase [Pseudohalioglobus lutimaris]|uniref:Protein-tyrosine-phosphatase n=1 Tax=Pseudohalioglobus lutimaris TaxID=1737061 RepID=A0A2N5X5D7_9GAMM|nr:tyrosine-protein phosphatase [Pseudohalioglobus lutimaris]PLW69703.1 protein-tyrosine-phosphatase [Pseudohalioglobus lutimaris]